MNSMAVPLVTKPVAERRPKAWKVTDDRYKEKNMRGIYPTEFCSTTWKFSAHFIFMTLVKYQKS